MVEQVKNVGILAMEIYFPPSCVNQEAIEAHGGVSKGRYTVGFAQDTIAFCTDVEDVVSMSLTAVTSLLEKYEISPKQIGRLEVGSKTLLDRAKSLKTFLMQIFEENGNTNIEGVDSTNSCYGGTAALFNCVNWIESSSWDGRYGLVVCTDSSVYADVPAGGSGTVAMLVGPNAPIVFESKFRGSHMAHSYDAYKPDLLNSSDNPVVDLKLLSTNYPRALGVCYEHFCSRYESLEGKQFSVNDADYFVFHTPFTKFVQKCFAGLLFNDFLRNASSINEEAKEKFAPFATLSGIDIYLSRDLEKASQQVAKPTFDAKVQPSTLLAKETGNTGTASLYISLASLIHNKHNTLVGNRLIMYSYGSGLAATMFSLRVNTGQHPFTVSNIASNLNVDDKLKARHEFPVEKFLETLKLMEDRRGAKDFVTSNDTSFLAPGTYYLTEVDSMYRRIYAKKPGKSACFTIAN